MANAKTAAGEVLGTVTSAAKAVTSLFDTAADSVGMLNKFVADAAEAQRTASDYKMGVFEDNLIRTISAEQTKQDKELSNFFKEDPVNRKLYNDAQYRILCAVAKRRGEPMPVREESTIPGEAPAAAAPQAAPRVINVTQEL